MGLFSTKYKLDESDKATNKIFERIIIVLAFMLVLSPIITSLCCLIGIKMDMLNVMILVMVMYLLVSIFKIAFNFIFISWKKPTVLQCLGIGIVLWLVIVALVNDSVNYTFFFYIFYFACFCMFAKLDKKHYKVLLFTFVIELTLCSIMGLIDPRNDFMPGFSKRYFPMSLQFANPNYASYVLFLAIMACAFILVNYKKVWEQVVFWICYLVMNFAIFVNGSYSGEAPIFLGLFFLVLFFWIKNKKCPWEILTCLAISIGLSFASVLYPNIWDASTASANFFYESLAIFDNLFGTDFLGFVSYNMTGGEGTLSFVAGADGYDRGELFKECINACTSSPRAFIFGNGAGYNYDILVHNLYLQIWLENGIIGLGLYVAVIVLFAIKFFKNIKFDNQIFGITAFVLFVLVIHNIGCLESYSFIYFIMLFAVLYRSAVDIEKGKTESKDDSETKKESIADVNADVLNLTATIVSDDNTAKEGVVDGSE